MKFSLLKSLTTVGLGLFLGSVFGNPVKAQLVHSVESSSENQLELSQPDSILISQLFGHELYKGEPQIEWGNLMLGRVVGEAGSIMFVVLPDGTYFNDVGAGYPGYDVLVAQDENGRYYIVDAAHSEWISVLESEYGWRRITRLTPPLTERTAPIWSQLGSSRSSTTQIQPRSSTPARPYTPPTQSQYDEPVRGLW